MLNREPEKHVGKELLVPFLFVLGQNKQNNNKSNYFAVIFMYLCRFSKTLGQEPLSKLDF